MSDPYRTLGVQPGAPMAEVKKAYRRLAKAYHPDSAGEAALPRFLAIHEAYESIRTGRPIPAVRRGPAGPAGGPAQPWRADPDRARAAREQARRRAGGRAAGSASGPGATGPSAGSAGPRRGSARTGSTGSRPGGPSGATGRRRNTRKATMGSTSYDEARDPNDPTWSGASWYGPSTGEYWIINPREYADPRKHGPEYQSRARRMAGAGEAGSAPDAAIGGPEAAGDWTASEGAFETAPEDAPAPAAARRSGTRPRAASASTAASAAGRTSRSGSARTDGWAFDRSNRPAAAATTTRASARARSARDSWGSAWPAEGDRVRRATRATGRRLSASELLTGSSDDPVRRLGLALLAWPPIGVAAAGVIGTLTGCATYSADCGGTEPLLPWLAQAVILGLLLLLPPLARVLAGGTFGMLAALVPLTFFLIAVGGSGAPEAGGVLAVLLALAWVAGVAWGLAAARRRLRGPALTRPGAGA